MKKLSFFVATHVIAGAIGIGIGIYMLPILTAPVAPSESEVSALIEKATYIGKFRRDLEGSDFLH